MPSRTVELQVAHSIEEVDPDEMQRRYIRTLVPAGAAGG
jgi:hypothetical protein